MKTKATENIPQEVPDEKLRRVKLASERVAWILMATAAGLFILDFMCIFDSLVGRVRWGVNIIVIVCYANAVFLAWKCRH